MDAADRDDEAHPVDPGDQAAAPQLCERDRVPVKLSRLEFDLLCQLASDPTRVFAKAELMQAVWGYSAPERTRTLDSHACRLRSKLSSEGGDRWIANRWGHGYKLHGAE